MKHLYLTSIFTLLTILAGSQYGMAQCSVTSTTDGTTCIGQAGAISATANGSNKIYWYDQLTGGNLLDSGSVLTIPNAAMTTTYYAEAAGGTAAVPDSLNTLAPNNGQSGAFFDCRPKKDITVTGFNFVPRGSGSYTVRVYYKTGTHVGNETNSSAWTLLGTSSSFSVTANNLTRIPVSISQKLNANQTYAFYVIVTAGSSLGYTNGSSLGAVATQNSDLIIYQGRGSGGLFSSSLFTTRTFAGTMLYEVGSSCTSARTGVMLTVHPLTAVDSQTVIDSSCQDFPTSLYANAEGPVTTYQWQIFNSTLNEYVNVAPPFVNNGSTLDVTSANDTLNGAKIRCILKGPCGDDTSKDMTMVILPKPTIVSDPVDITTTQGQNIIFQVNAIGVGVTYQWQVGVNGVFSNINDGGIYQGVKTNRLRVNGVSYAQNEYQFRCAVNGDPSFCLADPDTSEIAVLYVDVPSSVSNISSQGNTAIYPNPTKDGQVFISSELNNISSFKIVDNFGRVVQTGDLTPNTNNAINISKLVPSVYSVHIYNNKGEQLKTLKLTKL